MTSNETPGNGAPSDDDLAAAVGALRAQLATPQGVPSLGAMFDCIAMMAHARDDWTNNLSATVCAQALRIEDLEARLARFETAQLSSSGDKP